jgi:hypothetical protein
MLYLSASPRSVPLSTNSSVPGNKRGLNVRFVPEADSCSAAKSELFD